MVDIFVLRPRTNFFSQDGKTNREKIHKVSFFRNKEDPFYIIPEHEDDARYYWTGYDLILERDVQFSCFKKDAIRESELV